MEKPHTSEANQLLPDKDSYQPASQPSSAKPLLKPSSLSETCFILPGNIVFVDKVLPSTSVPLSQNLDFPTDYFTALHKVTSAPGSSFPAFTPNFSGARVPLRHTRLNISRWRHHLVGYEDAQIIQFLEFGFLLV